MHYLHPCILVYCILSGCVFTLCLAGKERGGVGELFAPSAVFFAFFLLLFFFFDAQTAVSDGRVPSIP